LLLASLRQAAKKIRVKWGYTLFCSTLIRNTSVRNQAAKPVMVP
jgi:hypothetical protein